TQSASPRRYTTRPPSAATRTCRASTVAMVPGGELSRDAFGGRDEQGAPVGVLAGSGAPGWGGGRARHTVTRVNGIMFVHAHPDDETVSTGATMAHYATAGVPVTLVTCTLGEE